MRARVDDADEVDDFEAAHASLHTQRPFKSIAMNVVATKNVPAREKEHCVFSRVICRQDSGRAAPVNDQIRKPAATF